MIEELIMNQLADSKQELLEKVVKDAFFKRFGFPLEWVVDSQSQIDKKEDLEVVSDENSDFCTYRYLGVDFIKVSKHPSLESRYENGTMQIVSTYRYQIL